MKILFLGEQPPCLLQGCHVTNVSPAQIYKFQMKVVCLSTQIIFHQVDGETPKSNNLLSSSLLGDTPGHCKASPKRNKDIFLPLLTDIFHFSNWSVSPSYESMSFFWEGNNGNISARIF